MRRRMALMALATLLAVLLVLTTIVALTAAAGPTGDPTPWRAELARYLQNRLTEGLPPAKVISEGRAELPWEFDAGMGGVTYGDGTRYHTDSTYAGRAVTPGPRPNPFIASGLDLSGPGLELHYPPAEVWCVTLQAAGPGDGAGRWLIFVARHDGGLYSTGWVTHERQEDPSSPEMVALLAKIGCR